jgi:hypothetical protein
MKVSILNKSIILIKVLKKLKIAVNKIIIESNLKKKLLIKIYYLFLNTKNKIVLPLNKLSNSVDILQPGISKEPKIKIKINKILTPTSANHVISQNPESSPKAKIY